MSEASTEKCRHEGGEADCPTDCLTIYGGHFARSAVGPGYAFVSDLETNAEGHNSGRHAPQSIRNVITELRNSPTPGRCHKCRERGRPCDWVLCPELSTQPGGDA